MSCGDGKPCGCSKCGPYTLNVRGYRRDEGIPVGARRVRAWDPRDVQSDGSVTPFGGKLRVVSGPGPVGTRLRDAWVPGGATVEESPGIPVGAMLSRPWGPSVRDADSSADSAIRFGVRPSMEERPEFQLPVGGQDFLGLITKLPSESAVRSEAARTLMNMNRMWWEFVAEQMAAVPIEWRLDVVRAWGQVTALLPAVWLVVGYQLVEKRPFAERINALRDLATVVLSIAPQYYQEAIDLLGGTWASLPISDPARRPSLVDGVPPEAGEPSTPDAPASPGVPTEQWVERLRDFAASHPKWVNPPALLTTTFTVLPAGQGFPAQHFVPPPPAPQAVCVVTEFDPAWGTPPRWYRGAPVRFDAALGAYEYDSDPTGRYARGEYGRMIPLDPAGAGDPAEVAAIRKTYEQGKAVLQPFKRPGSSNWEFRWIARDRNARCNPL